MNPHLDGSMNLDLGAPLASLTATLPLDAFRSRWPARIPAFRVRSRLRATWARWRGSCRKVMDLLGQQDERESSWGQVSAGDKVEHLPVGRLAGHFASSPKAGKHEGRVGSWAH